jgi:CDP-glucose 4,6-dehydratase
VIGGGDYSVDRIIPDCVRAVEAGKDIIVRNPYSIRPYQHVLEPVFAYLLIAQNQFMDKTHFEGSYNVGPNDDDCITTEQLVDCFCTTWGKDARWINVSDDNAPHEANFLKLDHSKITSMMNWKPKWGIKEAIEKTIEFSKVKIAKDNIALCMQEQIKNYMKDTYE